MERGEALTRLGSGGRRGPSAQSECCFIKKIFNLTIFKKQIQDQRKIEQKVYRFYIYASVSLQSVPYYWYLILVWYICATAEQTDLLLLTTVHSLCQGSLLVLYSCISLDKRVMPCFHQYSVIYSSVTALKIHCPLLIHSSSLLWNWLKPLITSLLSSRLCLIFL